MAIGYLPVGKPVTGLGLAITQSIVLFSGGKIGVAELKGRIYLSRFGNAP